MQVSSLFYFFCIFAGMIFLFGFQFMRILSFLSTSLSHVVSLTEVELFIINIYLQLTYCLFFKPIHVHRGIF